MDIKKLIKSHIVDGETSLSKAIESATGRIVRLNPSKWNSEAEAGAYAEVYSEILKLDDDERFDDGAKITALEKENAELKKQVLLYFEKIGNLKEEIGNLKDKVSRRNMQIKDLEKKLSELQDKFPLCICTFESECPSQKLIS